MKKRILLALVVATVLFGAVYASAANLGVNGNVIQAGVDGTLTCDPDGVEVTGWGYESNDQRIYYVEIGGIAAACEGQEIVVGLYNSSGGELGSEVGGPVPAGGGEVTVSFPNHPLASEIYSIHVAID